MLFSWFLSIPGGTWAVIWSIITLIINWFFWMGRTEDSLKGRTFDFKFSIFCVEEFLEQIGEARIFQKFIFMVIWDANRQGGLLKLRRPHFSLARTLGFWRTACLTLARTHYKSSL